MSVNCVYCGHVNPDGSTVCQSCGRTLPPAPSGGAGSYGQPSWGQTPQAPPGGASYPPQNPSSYPPQNPASYPPQNPSSYPPQGGTGGGYGGSYPPAQDPNAGWGGGQSYGNQPGSYGNQQGGFGTPQAPPSSYPPPAAPPSYGNASPGWGTPAPAFGGGMPMAGGDAASAKQMATIAIAVSGVGILIGWCCYLGLLLGPVGAILGFVARSKMSKAGSTDGQGLATGAIILGFIAFVEPIVLLIISLVIGSIGSLH